MAVKVFIKRQVPEEKARDIIPLVRQMRSLATNHEGYISGETLRNLERPEEFMVISTWQSSQDWKQWIQSEGRKEIQGKIDSILGGETEYQIFHYGFKE
ncbi:MAG: antibiotic biosynthesis monooxygenase [Deltaproteobacteria bacterium]|nr:antibiotic biosynthesis monooxygenase [Deltaproteobacteria bacterium]MBT8373435.1 antibiotic biosynthesis monooxygenase [Deltaproteobacteria bacterium]NNL41891.1 antibiotic biosynthesis monooxygenase [Desulfobacterales bacterium]